MQEFFKWGMCVYLLSEPKYECVICKYYVLLSFHTLSTFPLYALKQWAKLQIWRVHQLEWSGIGTQVKFHHHWTQTHPIVSNNLRVNYPSSVGYFHGAQKQRENATKFADLSQTLNYQMNVGQFLFTMETECSLLLILVQVSLLKYSYSKSTELQCYSAVSVCTHISCAFKFINPERMKQHIDACIGFLLLQRSLGHVFP